MDSLSALYTNVATDDAISIAPVHLSDNPPSRVALSALSRFISRIISRI